MKKYERFKEKVNNFLYDHYKLKNTIKQTNGIVIAIVSAFIFAFGFCSFITPNANNTGDFGFKIVTGGVSGLSQNLAKILSPCGLELTDSIIEALGYSLFNFPLLLLSFFTISKRFTIMTLINVVVTSVFISVMPKWELIQSISANSLIAESPISRILFGAACTGLATALAFKAEISCGGIDIISYFLAIRKSTSVGKYGVVINAFIISLYSLLMVFGSSSDYDLAIISLFYSAIYLFVVMLIVDAINLRNKKVQLQFVTSRDDFGKILLAHFPHGATITKGIGAYSNSDRYVVYMVVSSFEVNRVIKLSKQIDKHVFITVTSLIQVYGNFFIRPIN
jgi:uncharacterized membrane-anchored protein YitT (DUF2179 family)